MALHERTWVFPCIAYLPVAKPKFERLDDLIHMTLEKADGEVDEVEYNARIYEMHEVVQEILTAVEERLARLVYRPK